MEGYGLHNSIKHMLFDETTLRLFRTTDALGTGASCICVRVEDFDTEEEFACKVLSADEYAWQEIKLHSSLKHPNIVKLHHAFQEDKYVYLLMELCDMDLHTKMLRGKLTEEEARLIIDQLTEGLNYLHNNKVILHRDLKPGNIFMKGNQVKIGDFGMSVKLSKKKGTVNLRGGSAGYMSPERLVRLPYGLKADIFALGCISHHLLYGKKLYKEGAVESVKFEFYASPPGTAPELDTMMRGLLAKIEENRWDIDDLRRSEYLGRRQRCQIL